MDLTLVVQGHSVYLPAAIAMGVGVGFVAGMFGVGGGFLLVPLLHVLLGVPLAAAIGVGLCQIIATGLGTHLRYRKLGHAESRFDVMLLGGSLLGVHAGARLLHSLQGMGTVDIAGKQLVTIRLVVTAMYVALFVVMAYLLWTRPAQSSDADVVPGPLARVRIPPMADLPIAGLRGISGPFVGYIGFVNGVLAGMLGIGGGICLIPIMMYGFGFNIRKVAGTGIIIVLFVATLGTIQHARLGNVHLGLAVILMTGSALSAQVGASLTRSLSANTLRRGLAIIMIITCLIMLAKLLS